MSNEDNGELLADAQNDVWDGAVQALSEISNDDPDWDSIRDAGHALVSASKRGEYASATIESDAS